MDKSDQTINYITKVNKHKLPLNQNYCQYIFLKTSHKNGMKDKKRITYTLSQVHDEEKLFSSQCTNAIKNKLKCQQREK